MTDASSMARLVVVSAVVGGAMTWVMWCTTDLEAARRARKRIQAHLLELLLFGDEPGLVWAAQKSLLAANARLLRLLLPCALVLALFTVWLLPKLESAFGYEPLHVGEPSVITVQMNRTLRGDDADSMLEVPPGITLETAPVRIFATHRISWRIRPVRAVCGELRFTAGGQTFATPIAAGCRPVLLSPRHGAAGEVAWLEVDYPKSNAWIGWFFLFSIAGALPCAQWLRLRL